MPLKLSIKTTQPLNYSGHILHPKILIHSTLMNSFSRKKCIQTPKSATQYEWRKKYFSTCSIDWKITYVTSSIVILHYRKNFIINEKTLCFHIFSRSHKFAFVGLEKMKFFHIPYLLLKFMPEVLMTECAYVYMIAIFSEYKSYWINQFCVH
jgi:hypothetical protein